MTIFVLDTNVLVNGFLMPQSPAHYVLAKVRRKEIRGIVCDRIFQEASGLLSKAANACLEIKGIDWQSELGQFISHAGVEFVADPSRNNLDKYASKVKENGADKTVCAIAWEHSASICSADVKDLNVTTTRGISCFTADDIYRKDGITPDNVMKAWLPRQDKGCVVFRFSYSVDKNDFINHKSNINNILTIQGLGSLDLITGSNMLSFSLNEGPEVRVSIEKLFLVKNYPLLAFCSYDKQKGEIELIAIDNKMSIVSDVTQSSLILSNSTSGEIGRPEIFKNGTYPARFDYLAAFPYPLNVKMARNIAKGTRTDNPFERLNSEDKFRVSPLNIYSK